MRSFCSLLSFSVAFFPHVALFSSCLQTFIATLGGVWPFHVFLYSDATLQCAFRPHGRFWQHWPDEVYGLARTRLMVFWILLRIKILFFLICRQRSVLK